MRSSQWSPQHQPSATETAAVSDRARLRVHRARRALGGVAFDRALHLGGACPALTLMLARQSRATVEVVPLESMDDVASGEWDLVVCEGLSGLDDVALDHALSGIEAALVRGGTLLVVADEAASDAPATEPLGRLLLQRAALSRTYTERRWGFELHRFLRV